MTLAELAEAERELLEHEAALDQPVSPLSEEELDGVRFTHGSTVRAVRLG